MPFWYAQFTWSLVCSINVGGSVRGRVGAGGFPGFSLGGRQWKQTKVGGLSRVFEKQVWCMHPLHSLHWNRVLTVGWGPLQSSPAQQATIQAGHVCGWSAFSGGRDSGAVVVVGGW